MKKNVMMRVASIMLVLVLMSSSVISGTFAKYVTSAESNDSARVAKFGVTVTANFGGMFTRGYKLADTTSTNKDDEASVWANSAVDVVAPGTEGALGLFDVEGKPEVDVVVNYTADFELGDNWILETNDTVYCPIVITVNYKGAVETFGMNDAYGTGLALNNKYDTIEAFEQGVEAAITGKTATYEANTDLKDVDNDLVVTWAWVYSTTDANDIKDTQLGDQAAANAKEAGTIAMKVSCTVTQVD